MTRRDPNYRCTCCNKPLTNTEQKTLLCCSCTPPLPPTECEAFILKTWQSPTIEDLTEMVRYLLEKS